MDGTVLAQSIFPSLVALTGTALGFYFGSQTGGGPPSGEDGNVAPLPICNLSRRGTRGNRQRGIELIAISLIRTKYVQAPFVFSALQVIVGALVFAAGTLIGSA